MKGIMSCSFNQLVPLGYAIANTDDYNTGVLFVINLGHSCLSHFKMNSGYTPFISEEEVVIMDG